MADFDSKRRKFLIDSLTMLGIAMMPFPRGFLQSAFAQGSVVKGRRQYLVTMIDNGGWDSQFTLNYLDPSLVDQLSDAPAGWSPIELVRYGSTSSAGTHRVNHPSGGALAPGMKFWNQNDFARSMIIRGLPAIAGHRQHQFVYGGGTSPYLPSFSALVADHQAATRGVSPLHYVKIANGTRDIIHSAMMTGVAIPSLMPNQASWRTLTTPRAAGAGSAQTDAQLLENSLAALGEAAKKKLSRNASKDLVTGYSVNYSASVSLSNSNYANSAPFLNMWLKYFNALKKEAADQVASGLGSIGDFRNTRTIGQGQVESGFAQHFGALASASLTTANIQNTSGVAQVEFARQVAWRLALTEFLIVNDLSSVVDFSPSGNDSHRTLTYPGFQNVIAVAGMRELMRALAAAPNPDGGGSLLDCTLITYASEFDRWGAPFVLEQGAWGTNHGDTFSMIMAGHRCNTGKLFGQVTAGPQASGLLKNNEFGRPIGMDPNTGQLIAGAGVSAYSILPTVCAIMGVEIPPQQVTEFKAIPAFMKG